MTPSDWLVWLVMLGLAYWQLGIVWLGVGLVSFALSHFACRLGEKKLHAKIEKYRQGDDLS